MFGEHHDPEHEFPEFENKIREMKEKDPEFAKIYGEYQAIDDEIFRIEQQIETPSDFYTEDLKKKRLMLKDQLYEILRHLES